MQDIKVTREYAPMAEKIDSIKTIMELSLAPTAGFYIPTYVKVFTLVEEFRLYTDFELDEEKTPTEVYDELYALAQGGVLLNCSKDIKEFEDLLNATIGKFETYQMSAYGILDSMQKEYNDIGREVDEALKKVKDSKEDFSLLNDVVTKLV